MSLFQLSTFPVVLLVSLSVEPHQILICPHIGLRLSEFELLTTCPDILPFPILLIFHNAGPVSILNRLHRLGFGKDSALSLLHLKVSMRGLFFEHRQPIFLIFFSSWALAIVYVFVLRLMLVLVAVLCLSHQAIVID